MEELIEGVRQSFSRNPSETSAEIPTENLELSIDENMGFPIHIFPAPFKRIITETNQKLNYPIDFIASSILYSVSVAIGNALSIKVKEGWNEQAIIWIALVGRPGTNKSHPFSFALEPLRHKQQELFADYKIQLKEYERINALTKEEKQSEGITENPAPICKRYILQDFTIESMADKHNENPRGLGINVDELATWLGNMNKYNGGSDQEVWLSTWSSKSLLIDRKSMKEAISIKLPFLSVGGTTQDGILKKLFSGSKQNNGFIDRMLFTYPNELEYPKWNEQEIEPFLVSEYRDLIYRLLDLPCDLNEYGAIQPKELPYSKNGKYHMVYWYNAKAELLNSQQNSELSSTYSKIEIYLHRFALIIQALRWACGEAELDEIDEISVIKAIDLVEYFKNNAFKVQNLMNPLELDQLDELRKNLFLALPHTFKRKEGFEIAKNIGVKQSAYDAFLKNDKLFIKAAYGQFKKKIG